MLDRVEEKSRAALHSTEVGRVWGPWRAWASAAQMLWHLGFFSGDSRV